MRMQAFDAFTREVSAGVSRRTSLLTLGGAALSATIASPQLSSAGKKGPDCKKKEKQRCSSDAAACKTTISTVCELSPSQCAALLTCCDECSAGGFLICFAAVV